MAASGSLRKKGMASIVHDVQVPGLNYTKKFSPVVLEVTFCIVLILMLKYKWVGEIVNVKTAFLYRELEEEIYLKIPARLDIVTGEEFKDEECLVLQKAMYGLVQAARQFYKKLVRITVNEMGFKKCNADGCLLMRVKKLGTVILCIYVDNMLVISLNATQVLEDVKSESIKFKNDKIAPPENYLGAKLQLKSINQHYSWTITSMDYINTAVQPIRDSIKEKKWKLPKRAKTSMSASYYPELDTSPELDSSNVMLFQEIIGMLRWAIEQGRVDIAVEVSLLSQYHPDHC